MRRRESYARNSPGGPSSLVAGGAVVVTFGRHAKITLKWERWSQKRKFSIPRPPPPEEPGYKGKKDWFLRLLSPEGATSL